MVRLGDLGLNRCMRAWILKLWARILFVLDAITGRYLYVIPVVMGGILVVVVMFVISSVFSAIDDMDRTIKSIPSIVQVEMEKTRSTLQQEGESNRQVLVDQHTATREELLQKLNDAEAQNKATKAALDKLQKDQTAVKKQIENPPPAKRQKILGIF